MYMDTGRRNSKGIFKEFNHKDFQDFQDVSNISDEFCDIKYAFLKINNSHVVLKFLKENNEAEYYNKFNREIKNLRNIEPNENVIKFLGVTKEPSKNFYSIVLEYCGNKNLDEDLEDVSKKSWHYKIKMAKDLANGLSYIHMENIILCNLNSKNIISYKDKLVITNFSSAVSLDNQMKPTIEPTIEITDKNVAYVDPKCFNSTKMFNKPSDIYSLGVILWEITSGKPAFYNNQDIEELKISLIYGIRESPIELTPVDYKELYCDAWNKDKHKRPPIKDFINCLDEIDLDLIYHNYDIIQEISYRENNSITKEEACLKIIEGSPRNQYLFLPEGEILVGRNYSNHIVIKDQEINKKHAKIINYHGKVEITCFDSESIIYINEEVFSRSRILKRHDVIKMGRSVFKYIPAREFNIGHCYRDGNGTQKNQLESLKWYMKPAENGSRLAQAILTNWFQEGAWDISEDTFKFLYISADNGNNLAQGLIASCFLYGIVVYKDNEKAFQWAEKSARGGSANGQYNLGLCYQKGIGTEKNSKEAFQCYKDSAQAGDTNGQYQLGFFYQNGIGVEKNDVEAFKWYKASAQGGNTDGQCQLGLCYQNGIGVEKNSEIAVQHYKESAQGGNINGQYQLGMCYLDGIGVKKNGILSRPKTILKKNSKKAYMLFMKSAASGNSEAREMLISKFQPSIPPQVSPFLPDENEVLKIDKKWYSILDEKLPLIEPKHYFMLSDLIPQPNLLSNEIHMNVAAVLPYIRQKVKMRDVDILKAENFAKLVIDQEDEESSDDESKVENKKLIKRNRLSRFDCIATLLASAECSVAKDIFQTVPQLPIAFPLLIPDLDNAEKFKVMLPLFIGSTIKCCTSNESIIENHLFEDSFKLIVAVQVGMNTRGKSTILNQLMASENMFTSYSEPRTKYGIPHMIDGSVEFVWLTEETCGDYLWNNVFKNYYEKGRKEIILLANLHGDALRYQDRLEFLKQLPSYFLVFLQPGDEDQKDELKKLIGSKKVRDIYVNPKDNAIKEVYKNFEDVLDSNLGGYSFNELTELEMGETLQLAQNIKCDESQELINFVKDKTCHHTKLEIMQLQKQQFKDEFDFLKFLQSKPELRLFSSIIALRPIKKRIRALTHLEIELSRLFAEESSKLLRNDAILKVNQLNNTSLMNLFKKNNIREDVTKLLEEVDNTNLRIEHFFRGLGYMYTMCKSFVSNPKINDSDNDPIKENILRSPGYYADLLINGYTIELLDGDSTTISEAWFLAVCKYINKRFPDLKIFVISILGLQSSGKSTLLNALFACKFAVSARRCTRGLLMQFLFLEKDLSNKLGVDAFILIDSEGLCAPEKMVGTESEKKDRMLVHFAMQISNLTIINILGNSEEELDKILSITIGIMIILDKSLNIFIVQHAIDNNKVELKQKFHENFQKILRKTVKATDSKMGAHNKEYLSKIEDENLLKIFAPFKNNTASYSPPSKQYHEDIVDLYKSIIKNCENSKNKKKFSKWFQLIKGYWDAVVREDFSFLKINETYDFIELGIQSAKLKEIIDMAFLKHKKLIEYEIRTIVQESLSEGSSVDSIKLKCGELIKKLEGVPEIEIQEDCEECKKVAKERGNLSDYLEERNDIICKKETNQTFSAYIIDCRESKSNELKNMLEDILMRNRFFRQFEFIDRLLEMVLNKQKGIIEIWNLLCEKVSTENKAFMNEKINNKVEKEFEKMWTQDLFENYKNRTIPELSKINAISSFNFFMKKCLEPNDIAWLENEINYVTNQILSKTDNFDPEIVHELKAETEKIMNNLSTKLNIKFNSEFEMKVHAYAILTMLNTLEKGGKHNTLLEVLDKIEVEYKEKIQLRVKYDHLLEYKGHVTGDYLLKAIVKKAIDAESRYRRDHVLSISWMNNSETIRIQYFIELAEQIQNGDKNKLNKVAEHFLFPKEMIEKWFKNKVNECTDKGQKYKETSDQQFDYVRQEIRNCKSYTNIRKFVNKYMTQVDGIDYQLNIKDDSVDKNFEMFHNAIIKELDDKRTGYDQLKAESLPNPSDDKLVEKRLGCTELCYWCGALCWEERGHDNDYGETKRHHTSHQPGGLKGTHYSSTKQLVAMACHNRPNDAIVHYDNKQLRWDKAKSIDFKNWKFEPHYRTNFNEIMCWFFEMLNQNMAEKLYCKPANESELEKHGCFKKDYRKIISVLRQCLENGADN